MTNFLTIALLLTNWHGTRIDTVEVGYRTSGPFALAVSRDMINWRMIVATTNDWPQRGAIQMPRLRGRGMEVFRLVPPDWACLTQTVAVVEARPIYGPQPAPTPRVLSAPPLPPGGLKP